MASTGKIVEVLFEKTKETHEKQDKLVDLCSFEKPEAGTMQNSGNVVWRPWQQHAPILDGWDLAGQETDIIEETYPAILGTPKNDFVKQRADDMRDMRFWERRGEESGMKQVAELNKTIANAIRTQGSVFYRTNAASGYDAIAEAQARLNETQKYETTRCMLINDRDNLKYGSDLAGRQTVQGRPEMVWSKGMIGPNIAGFDVYTASFLPNLAGGADPATTVTADVSEKPEGGSVDTVTGVVTNVDCRVGTIPVTSSASYNVGDKVTFTGVQSLGLTDKTFTDELMTFTIVAKPDATSVQVYPKPIALDDPALSTLEKAYANINTQIASGAQMNRINIDASNKTNLFWDKSAVEVLGGTIPAELFKSFDGNKVISSTMSNGQELYMVYDGNIEDMSFRYRLFTWYGVTICDPSNCGSFVTY